MRNAIFALTTASLVSGEFNGTRFRSLSYVQELLDDSQCLARRGSCSSKGGAVSRSDRQTMTGIARVADASDPAAGACEFCSHGAHMLPLLIQRYHVRSLAEIGVCTGMTVVNVVAHSTASEDSSGDSSELVHVGARARRRGGGLDRYYLIDPWGGTKCKPGCGCSRHINQLAKAWPDVISPLRGYSVPMAEQVPNGTLDLAFIDAAHDFRSARADILAYWPKLKTNGVLAGHDFAHWRNYAEIRQDKQAARGPYSVRHATSSKPGAKANKALPPAYGVAQATQELFLGCHVHVRWNTWWVERATCELRELLTPAEVV